MAPSKRDVTHTFEAPANPPSKKHRPMNAHEATPSVTPQGPLRNRHLQAVLADGADLSPITNGVGLSNGHHHHHSIVQLSTSMSSPSSTPNNLSSVSKRRSIVNLNRSARKDLTFYAAKEEELTPGTSGAPGTPDNSRQQQQQQQQDGTDIEVPTPIISRVEYKNNLRSLHDIMSKSFDPKRAFNYNFINIMSSFINNDKGNVDFKLIGLSLDAGTRVFTSKVDMVFRNTQKVSNSLSMATGDEKGGGGVDFDEDDELLFDTTFARDAAAKKKKAAKKKASPTIVASTDKIDGKLEMNIAVDPLFHHFSAAFDVGNVNSLLMANLASNPVGALLLDSAEMLNFDAYHQQQQQQKQQEEGEPQPASSSSNTIDLSEFSITLGGRPESEEGDLEYGGGITVCPSMGGFDITDFAFNDRDASIDHLVTGLNAAAEKNGGAFPASQATADHEHYEFDIDAPVDDVDLGDDDDFGGDDINLGGGGGGGNDHLGVEDGGGGGGPNGQPPLNSLLDASLLEANLMDILPASKNEFFNKNFLRQVMRKVPFFKQGAGRSLLGGAPSTLDESGASGGGGASAAAAGADRPAPKTRTRPVFEENRYDAADDLLAETFEEPSIEVKESLSYALPTLNRWSANSLLLHLKDDYGFDTHLLRSLFTKENTYFNDLQRERMAALAAAKGGTHQQANCLGGNDSDDFGGIGIGGGGGVSDYEDDGGGGGGDDEDYNYERPDFNIADDYQRSTAAGAAATEQQQQQPGGHVDPLDIDYCRVAKKVDMKRVKRGMWDIIKEKTTELFPPTGDPSSQPPTSAEGATTTTTSTPANHGLTFSELRHTLPSHLKGNLNENLSLHTSFVALLHLANDKDLALAPIHPHDHSDFVITLSTAGGTQAAAAAAVPPEAT